MKRVISSQRYINDDILLEKMEEIKASACITLPIVDAEIQDLNGDDMFILIDGHHRKAAAEELGIEVVYEEVDNIFGLTGEDLLVQYFLDSDWYYVDNGRNVWQ